ncbi:MAG: hypothetical protein FVQ81_00665 [Candidatus Glassbacteria bacterium]|nr:hypothetical protein [Candidatus Glassbacteria bacterium]
MGCPACETDYDILEQDIENGRLASREQLENRLAAVKLSISGATVVYCPGCREKIACLMDRVAVRLRKETLSGIHDLLDRALEERRQQD